MTINVNPYMQFKGNAREAMEFYHDVLGGELGLTTFGEFGMGGPEQADLVMHSQLEIDGRAWLMGSDWVDGMDMPEPLAANVSLFGGVEDSETMKGQWAKLADGGTVVMPLEPAPWGDTFGMVVDKFGTFWQVNIGGDAPQG